MKKNIVFMMMVLAIMSCGTHTKKAPEKRYVASVKDLENLKQKISPQSVSGVLSSQWGYNDYVIYIDSNGRDHMERKDWIKTCEVINKHPEVMWDYADYQKWAKANSIFILDQDNWEFTMSGILNSFSS